MNTRIDKTHTKARSFGIGLIAGLTVALASGVASASAPLCFPQGGANYIVPGLFGAPYWYADSAAPAVRIDLNEPRWSNSALTSLASDPGSPSTGEGGIRLIVGGTNSSELNVSFQNTADGTPGNPGNVSGANDYVVFGVSSATSTVAVLITVTPGATDPAFDPSAKYWTYANGTWSMPTAGIPSWIKRWTDAMGHTHSTAATWTHSPVGADWAVQFTVNMASLGILPNTSFKMFVGMHKVDNMGVGQVDATTPALPPNFTTANLVPGTNILKDPTLWYGAPPLSTGCPTGIGFTSNLQIGTTNVPNSAINTTQGQTNTFVATPQMLNYTGTVYAGDLQARFRWADWGAQIADPQATWPVIINGNAVANGAPVLADIPFQFNCPTNTSSTTCGVAVPAVAHQCMEVEIADQFGKSVPIQTPSVYRNMDFEPLSMKVLPAKISIKGLQAITGHAMDRDVYFDIVTRNMPALGNLPILLDSVLMNLLKSAALGLISAVNPFSDALSLDAQMKVAWPTYETHVYYDTGVINTNDGVPYHVVVPMNSFGYYFSHDGSLFGFTTGFGGPNMVSISNKTFKVRIPNEGAVTVQSGVTAEELPQALVSAVNRACQLFPFACYY